MTIRPLTSADWPEVSKIYREGVAGGDATFETEVPTWAIWDAVRHPQCRIVAEEARSVLGFAAISPISARGVYAGVADVMIYVDVGVRDRGIGGQLMAELVRCTEAADIWTLQASIFPENEASIRTHERAGFHVVGRRERIARFHDGRWRDTVLMERRSTVVGLD